MPARFTPAAVVMSRDVVAARPWRCTDVTAPSISRLAVSFIRTYDSSMRVAILCVAGFLLVSMGGAIVLAPATLPLLWWVRRPPAGRVLRGFGAAIAALTAAELVWF